MNNTQTEIVKARFIGNWKLVTNEFKRANGELFHPMSQDAEGLLIFTADDYMSVQIMRPNRPTFSSSSQFKGSLPEIRSAFEGYIAYYGTYEIDVENQRLINHVQGSWFPNWVGTKQIRYYQFDRDKIIFRTPSIPEKTGDTTGTLIWRKIDDQPD